MISFLKKIMLILTPSNVSGSGGKTAICQGQHCLNEVPAAPLRDDCRNIFCHLPWHCPSTSFSCPCSLSLFSAVSRRVEVFAQVGQRHTSAERAFDSPVRRGLGPSTCATHCPSQQQSLPSPALPLAQHRSQMPSIFKKHDFMQ